jgi:hypothetical protein
MPTEYFDRGNRPEIGKSGKRRKYKVPEASKPQAPSGADRFKGEAGHAGADRFKQRAITVQKEKAAAARREASQATDRKIAREKTFLGRMTNRRDDAKESINRFGNKIKGFKDRAVGGIAAIGKSARDKAERAKEMAKTVGRGAQAVGRTGLKIGKGIYGVGRDLAHLGIDAAHGVAATYRGSRKLYKKAKEGFSAANKAYNYMTGDASPEEKAKAVFHVAGEGAKLGGRAIRAGANIAGSAAKGVYKASVSKEHRKQVKEAARTTKRAYDYMTGDAPRTEKAAAAAKVLGKGAVGATKLAGKGLWEGAKLGGRALKGTYNWLRGK